MMKRAPLIMKGNESMGYCYVHREGCRSARDLEYWVDLIPDLNSRAKSSKRKKA